MRKHKEKNTKKQYIAWVIVMIGIMQMLHWILLWTNTNSREYLGALLIGFVTTISEIIDDFEVRRYNPLVGQILFLICSYLAILMNVSIQVMLIILGGIWIIYLRHEKQSLFSNTKKSE